MAWNLSYDLCGNAVQEHQAGKAMSQVMEATTLQASFSRYLCEGMAQKLGARALPSTSANTKWSSVVVFPIGDKAFGKLTSIESEEVGEDSCRVHVDVLAYIILIIARLPFSRGAGQPSRGI